VTPSLLDEHFPEARPLARRLTAALFAFFFAPASARPLAALRIGLAAVLLAQAWTARAGMLALLAHDGIVQSDLTRHLAPPHAPRIDWIVRALSHLGMGETSSIQLVCGVYVASLILLATGCITRLASVLAWLLHWHLMNSTFAMGYGFDHYAHVFLFYLMWAPSGRAYSLDVLCKRVSAAPTDGARLALRLMQLHLCLSYFASGAAKSVGIQWWDGELLWRAMSLPVYNRFDITWLVGWPVLSQIGGLATLAIELGYFIFIWPRRTRKLWMAATLALHVGIAICLGLHLFGAIMCVLTAAIFGFSPEPADIHSGSCSRHRHHRAVPAPPDPSKSGC
jgi:hypothetical protein